MIVCTLWFFRRIYILRLYAFLMDIGQDTLRKNKDNIARLYIEYNIYILSTNINPYRLQG